MSKYTYAGKFVNPAANLYVSYNSTLEVYEIWVQLDEQQARKHTSAPSFTDEDEANEYIEAVAESFEEDYNQYLDENRDEIRRMEEYEQFRNEY